MGICFAFVPCVASAYTLVSGSVDTDTTWTTDGSPYIVQGSFDIPHGVTLTVNPGVVVKCSGNFNFTVDGRLVANGTPDNKIYFTTTDDDSVGGVTSDSKDFGPAGYWGITGLAASNISISYAEVRNLRNRTDFDGQGLYMFGNFDHVIFSGNRAMMWAKYAYLSFSHVTFEGIANEWALVLGFGGGTSLDDVTIENGVGGVSGQSVSVIASRLHVRNMSGRAIYSYGGYVSLSDSDIENINPGDGAAAVELDGTVPSTITNTTISNVSGTAISEKNGNLSVSSSTITHVAYGIKSLGSASVSITQSTLESSDPYAAASYGSNVLSAQNNFWGDPSGPYNPNSNPSGLGPPVTDNVDFSNWLSADPFGATTTVATSTATTTPLLPCCSNVIFFPGIEGSRLYTHRFPINNRLWEPNDDHDGSELEFDQNGVSINRDVFSRIDDGVIDRAYFVGPKIYQPLTDNMNSLKSSGVINDWEPIAYDWRLPYEQLLDNGKVDGQEISYFEATDSPYIISEVKRLAASSKTGKVTIIAHSNGGLLTKALMMKLSDEHIADIVDKIVFVAVPQTGAPESIGAILHGFGQGISVFSVNLFSANEARKLALNMPMTYNLLPSQMYFNSVETPVVTYEGSTTLSWFSSFAAHYGRSLSSYDAMKNFLLGSEGRGEPVYGDLNDPSVANATLLTSAAAVHGVLDNWTVPDGIRLVQIAGWGVDTPSGIDYYEGIKNGEPTVEYRPHLVEDGDGTVPVPSALEIPSSDNVERYWLDIRKYDSNTGSNMSHSNLFNIKDLEDFIAGEIQNSTTTSDIMSTTSPQDDPDKELRFSLFSASSTIDLFDGNGNHTGVSTTTGLVEENISGTSYKTFGNVSLITVKAPENAPPKTMSVVVRGNAEDSATVSVEKVSGNAVVASKYFTDIPLSTTTEASFSVSADAVADDVVPISPLSIDFGSTSAEVYPSDTVSAASALVFADDGRTSAASSTPEAPADAPKTEESAAVYIPQNSPSSSRSFSSAHVVSSVGVKTDTPPAAPVRTREIASGQVNRGNRKSAVENRTIAVSVPSVGTSTKNSQTASVFSSRGRVSGYLSNAAGVIINKAIGFFKSMLHIFHK